MLMFFGYFDYQFFNLQFCWIVDDLYFEVLVEGKVIGSMGKEMLEDIDEEIMDFKVWIIILFVYIIVDNGVKIIIENLIFIINIYKEVGDLDVLVLYFNGQLVFNIFKEIIFKEVIEVEGIIEIVMWMQNINLLGG